MKIILIVLVLFNFANASINAFKEKELCTQIISKKIELLSDKCLKYTSDFESFKKEKDKLDGLNDSPKKKQLFKHYAIQYRNIIGKAEQMHLSINSYILHNYKSTDTATLKNIDTIFSDNNYIPSGNVIKKLADNNGGKLDISPVGLKKIKVYVKKIENEQKERNRQLKEIERQDYRTTTRVATQQTRTNARKSSRYTSQKSNNSLLQSVDRISMNGLYTKDDNTLQVTFFYKNKAMDKQVYWKNGNVLASCYVYEERGTWRQSKIGAEIGRNVGKKLNRAFQDMYIKTSSTNYKNGIVECQLVLNGKRFKTSNSFLFDY